MTYLDFVKAFDSVPHKRLLSKLRSHGVFGNAIWGPFSKEDQKSLERVPGAAARDAPDHGPERPVMS